MNGASPLSWPTLDAWSRHTGARPTPEEIDALFMLDGILLNPGPVKTAE